MKWKQSKVWFTMLALLTLVIVAASPVPVYGEVTSDADVDVLYVGDEEIMDGYMEWPDPWWWWLGVFYDRPLTEIIEQECFPVMQGSFREQLGIDLVLHGWASWDSEDGTNDAYDMLQEAIRETGGSWVSDPSWPGGGYWRFNRGMIWNGIVIDICVFWTWQDMDPIGFAPPQWGAAIVYFWDIIRGAFVPQHEISHLYGAQHCSHAWCIMNTGYAWYTDDWQSTCKTHMINHKDDFTRYVLTIASGTGGTTSPPPGKYLYYKGTTVTVRASSYSSYTFNYWVLDGTTKYGNPIAVTMNSDHGLKAYFRYTGGGGGGGGGCPILFVWNTEYVCEGLLDIHNPDGTDVIVTHKLATVPQRVNGMYLLRLTEHPLTHSHIDEVKLYAVLGDGTMLELPLNYARHSEHGNVLARLLFSDDYKMEILGADHNNGTSQSIDLKFSALSPRPEITGFIFQMEGNNMIYKVLL